MSHPEPLIASTVPAPILEKVKQGERLTVEDGVHLYECPDLPALGALAQIVRERLNGRRAFYVYNQHINYSNLCINGCRFCAFQRREGEPGAYRMTVEEVAAKVRERMDEPIR
ncbi:MAG: aminofutalosine synthase MqnE, partial [Planctomycetes bacterium]|nr:aminofutalosine synthase MqnE [Planctomycetota bacterium]